jgi:hypothetical protein
MTIRLQMWLALLIGAALLLVTFGALAALFVGWLAPNVAAGGALLGPFALAGVVLLALFAPAAWLLARLAYAPVRDVTKTARSIMSTGQLDRRCFYPGPRDDVGELVVVMNGLLVCYDLAIGRIRRLEAGRPSCTCPRDEPGFDPSDFVIDLKTHHEGARSI